MYISKTIDAAQAERTAAPDDLSGSKRRKRACGGNFFAVDLNIVRLILSVGGLNAGLAYLVLARGTGPDQLTTSWAANAVERYTGMTRTQALDAIDVLTGRLRRRGTRFVTPSGTKAKPRYKLHQSGESELIWLPNGLVDGVSDETLPLQRLRRLKSRDALFLLLNCYRRQSLADHGGIDWRGPHDGVRRVYEREKWAERARWSIYAFNIGDASRDPHARIFEETCDGNFDASGRNVEAWNHLIAIGLIEHAPHLVDGTGADGAIICELDAKMRDEAEDVVLAALPDCYRDRHRVNGADVLFPVSHQIPNVAVVGIFRTRYRADTTNAIRWASRDAEGAAEMRDEIRKVAASAGVPIHDEMAGEMG